MKFLVLALLTVSSLANAAQWTPLGENNFGAFYVDKASITQSQDLIQVDTLLNWVEPHTLLGNDTKTYQSEVALAYLNCKNSELAFGSRTMYADSNGMGHVVFHVKNIDDLLGDLNQTYRRLRQSSIDEELFEVISGFEAMRNDKK